MSNPNRRPNGVLPWATHTLSGRMALYRAALDRGVAVIVHGPDYECRLAIVPIRRAHVLYTETVGGTPPGYASVGDHEITVYHHGARNPDHSPERQDFHARMHLCRLLERCIETGTLEFHDTDTSECVADEQHLPDHGVEACPSPSTEDGRARLFEFAKTEGRAVWLGLLEHQLRLAVVHVDGHYLASQQILKTRRSGQATEILHATFFSETFEGAAHTDGIGYFLANPTLIPPGFSGQKA